MSHPLKPDAGVPDPVAAAADPAKAVKGSAKRFASWVDEVRAR
jgi:hypothetical protein